MRFCLFRNDKSTFRDELLLIIIVAASIGLGFLLTIAAPSIWIIKPSTMKVLGVLFIIIGVMFFPGLIYRLFTNDPKN